MSFKEIWLTARLDNDEALYCFMVLQISTRFSFTTRIYNSLYYIAFQMRCVLAHTASSSTLSS